MALPKFKTQAEIPEAFREEYVQEGEEWVPKPAELSEAGKLALQRERDAKKAEKIRADAAEAALAELKQEKDAKDRGVSAEALQAIRDAETLARKPILDENEALKANVKKLTLTDRVQKLALESGILPDRIEDAMTLLDKRTDLTDDGKDIVVKDKDGNITTEKVENFLKVTFKKEKPWYYAGTGASGSGSSGSNGAGGDGDAPKLNAEAEAERKRTIQASF